MGTFEEYSLIIPPLWEKEAEWKDALSEAEGVEKDLVLCQLRAVNLLKEIPKSNASPERVGWLSLWAKAFGVLDGARGTLSRQADIALSVLERVAFEWALHSQAILEPVGALQDLEKASGGKATVTDGARELAWGESVARLQGYAAWCLWADKGLCEEFADPRTLRGIWDPKPVREIVADPQQRVAHEAFFGPLDIRNEHELKRDRAEQERQLKASLKRISEWLGDSRLQPWVAKLSQQDSADAAKSFFTLLEDTRVGVASRLWRIGLRFAYFRYVRGSMLVHGSTIDEVFQIGANTLAPAFANMKGDPGVTAQAVAGSCNQILLALYLLQKRIWPDLRPTGSDP